MRFDCAATSGSVGSPGLAARSKFGPKSFPIFEPEGSPISRGPEGGFVSAPEVHVDRKMNATMNKRFRCMMSFRNRGLCFFMPERHDQPTGNDQRTADKHRFLEAFVIEKVGHELCDYKKDGN